MARYDDDDDSDSYSIEPQRRRAEFDDPHDDRLRDERPLGVPPHSGPGVAAFIIALLAGVASFITLGIGVYIGATQGPLPQDDPQTALIGFGIIGSGMFAVIGAVLGVVGVFQSDRRIVYAVIGMIFNVLILFGICGILGVGLALGG